MILLRACIFFPNELLKMICKGLEGISILYTYRLFSVNNTTHSVICYIAWRSSPFEASWFIGTTERERVITPFLLKVEHKLYKSDTTAIDLKRCFFLFDLTF